MKRRAAMPPVDQRELLAKRVNGHNQLATTLNARADGKTASAPIPVSGRSLALRRADYHRLVLRRLYEALGVAQTVVWLVGLAGATGAGAAFVAFYDRLQLWQVIAVPVLCGVFIVSILTLQILIRRSPADDQIGSHRAYQGSMRRVLVDGQSLAARVGPHESGRIYLDWRNRVVRAIQRHRPEHVERLRTPTTLGADCERLGELISMMEVEINRLHREQG